MPSYLEKTLQPDESIVYRARIHWVIYLRGLLLVALGVALVATLGLATWVEIASAAVALIGLVMLINAFILRHTTELAVTNRRVVAKVGFIRRRTWEINSASVEGVEVQQSVPGRLLGYGTIAVKGTGGGLAPIPNVDDPIGFRNHVRIG